VVQPSFISGIKRLANEHPDSIRDVNINLLGQLEHSYETHKGYWKGGTVSVFGYGGGIIRASQFERHVPEVRDSTLRVRPPPAATRHRDPAPARR
jgi:sulfite reductase alpha subunit